MQPTSQNAAADDASAIPEAEDEAIRQLEELLGEKFPEIVRTSRAAFRRDLPELLRKNRGKWAAYSGERRLGIAKTQFRLYQDSVQQGCAPDDFVMFRIEPEAPLEAEILTPDN